MKGMPNNRPDYTADSPADASASLWSGARLGTKKGHLCTL